MVYELSLLARVDGAVGVWPPLYVPRPMGHPLVGTDYPGSYSLRTFASELPVGTNGELTPHPSWRCLEVGEGGMALVVGAAFRSVAVASGMRCIARPSVDASVSSTTACVREAGVVTCSAAPVITPTVTALPPTPTTAVLAGSPWTVVSTPSGATPVTGPVTITATNAGGGVMTATRGGTGDYDEVLDDEAAWATNLPAFNTVWTGAGSALSATVDPADVATLRFGPVAGLDTDVVVEGDETDASGPITFTLTWTDPVTCAGSTVESFEIYGVPEVIDLGDGTVGFDAPLRDAIDDAALHCAIPASTLLASPWYLDVGTSSSATLDLPSGSVQVSTGTSMRVDGTALTATCAGTRVYCTDACVSLDTPLNCGHCGPGVEICDGVDNDCDGGADEGCPIQIRVPNTGPYMSPSFGEGGGAGTYGTADNGCGIEIATGICVRTDTGGAMPTGNVRGFGFLCGTVRLVTNESTTPWTYSLETVTASTCGSGYGSSGGTMFSHQCGPGEVLDGVVGLAGTHIGQIQARCARWEMAESDGLWVLRRTGTTLSPTFGTGMGSAFSFTMPDHSASGFPGVLHGFSGRFEQAPFATGTWVRLEVRGGWPSVRYR